MSAKIVTIVTALMLSFSGLAWMLNLETDSPQDSRYINKAADRKASLGSEGNRSVAVLGAEVALDSSQPLEPEARPSSKSATEMLSRFYPTEPMLESGRSSQP